MKPDRDELVQAITDELECLWGGLDHAIRHALNGRWSIECGGLEARIKKLTRLVGETPWERIPIPLLEAGVYQRIHGEMDISVSPDMVKVAEVRKRLG